MGWGGGLLHDWGLEGSCRGGDSEWGRRSVACDLLYGRGRGRGRGRGGGRGRGEGRGGGIGRGRDIDRGRGRGRGRCDAGLLLPSNIFCWVQNLLPSKNDKNDKKNIKKGRFETTHHHSRPTHPLTS
jgi:hypothetical protein